MDSALIERLARLRGIGDAYHDYRGELKYFALDTKAAILRAMGAQVDDDAALGGDEFARTQQGNNNAYCQDNEISWVDWRLRETHHDLLEFVRLLSRLRRRHEQFRRDTWLKGAASRTGIRDVTWLNAAGSEMSQGDWQDSGHRAIGVWYSAQTGSAEHLLLLLNPGGHAATFTLPASAGGAWIRVFDTSQADLRAHSLGITKQYALIARSVALLEC